MSAQIESNGEICFKIECKPSHLSIRGNLVNTEDPEVDRKIEDEVIQDLESGNQWAWCDARVTATAVLNGHAFTGSSYWLGSCSYGSEEGFIDGGHFGDLKMEALADLAKVLQTAKQRGDHADRLLKDLHIEYLLQED